MSVLIFSISARTQLTFQTDNLGLRISKCYLVPGKVWIISECVFLWILILQNPLKKKSCASSHIKSLCVCIESPILWSSIQYFLSYHCSAGFTKGYMAYKVLGSLMFWVTTPRVFTKLARGSLTVWFILVKRREEHNNLFHMVVATSSLYRGGG